ncbi:MAG: hypothetical protein R3B90_14005 [Planctomycetaceae bacterium]
MSSRFPTWTEAAERLKEQGQRSTTVTGVPFPDDFRLDGAAGDVVTRDGDSLTIRGPMSPEQLASVLDLAGFEPLRPYSESRRQAFIGELESRGGPLSEDERTQVMRTFDTLWQPSLLVQAINTAGVARKEFKSWRELRREQLAGEPNLQRERPRAADLILNAAQVVAVDEFATSDPAMSEDELIARLRAAGEFSDRQAASIGAFLATQPTLADLKHDLAIELLKLARLTGRTVPQERLDWLLLDTRQQAAFEQKVNELFQASHITRFAWSGAFDGSGSPFWWIYEYVFQPLTATMFAMLAFYVASAAFRAFRAKNTEAVLLLGTAFIILLAQTYLGPWLTSWVPESLSALQAEEMKRYIMSLFNTAGNRAIMIGIALGIAATSLKILLGVDRSYLGRGDE